MFSYPEKERKSQPIVMEGSQSIRQSLRPRMIHNVNFLYLTEQLPTPKSIHFKTQKFFAVELAPPIRSKRLKQSLRRAKIIQRLMIDLSLGFKFTQRILRLLQTFKIRHLEATIKHPSYMYSENFGPVLKLLRSKKIEGFGLTISIPLDIIATLMAMHYRNFAIFKDHHLYSILRKINAMPRLSFLKLHLLSESFIHLTNQALLNLSQTFTDKKKLKKLKIVDINCPLKEITREAYVDFAKSIEKQSQLKALGLNFTGLRKLDADILMNSISKLTNIRSLGFSTDHALDEENTRALAICCQSLTNLQRLKLTYFPAHRNAYNIYFSDALQSQRNLVDLHLTMYSMNEEENYNLGSSLQSLVQLRELNLSFFLGNFTNRVTRKFIEAIESLNELVSITLKFSQSKIASLNSLMGAFQSSFELKALNLHFLHIADGFGEECIHTLFHSLENLTSLTRFGLVLTGNISVNLKNCLPEIASLVNTHEALIDFKIDLPRSSYLEVHRNSLRALIKRQRLRQMTFLLLSDGNIIHNY